MVKSAEAFRTISEVAEELDVPKHVLRFWEVKFTHVRPMKRGGGRRYYRPEDVELLRGIRHLLYREGYTIRGVQKILREQGADPVKQRGLLAAAASAAGVVPAGQAPAAAPSAPASAAPKRRANAAAPKGPVDGATRPVALDDVVGNAIAALQQCQEILRAARAASGGKKTAKSGKPLSAAG
ncbi:MAG: MerR family transcriptional regulator [Hyphomicrobiaceae bacterium]